MNVFWTAYALPTAIIVAEVIAIVVPLLIAIGASATLAQLAMTRAYRIGHTLAVSSLSYGTIAFASLFDWLFWHRALPLAAWLGMLLIIASGVVSLRLSPALEKARRATYNK